MMILFFGLKLIYIYIYIYIYNNTRWNTDSTALMRQSSVKLHTAQSRNLFWTNASLCAKKSPGSFTYFSEEITLSVPRISRSFILKHIASTLPCSKNWDYDIKGIYSRNKENIKSVSKWFKKYFLYFLFKQSHYRSGQALRVPGGWGSQISRHSAHESGKVVSPTHRPPLPPGNIPGTHFCKRLSHPGVIVRPEGYQWKIQMTPSGIEPATFRLVAQCLNQLRHRVQTSW